MAHRFDRLRLQRVRKVFGRVPVLRDVSCELDAGQVTLLMGPNGAGKSTLVEILATLGRPTDGEVHYGPHVHAHAAARLRHCIGLVAHETMLYGHLTAQENLVFFARLYGLADPGAAAARWLERVGLQDVATEPARRLSRGMSQRLALARALVHDPGLLLLDEPFTGLDRAAVAILRQLLALAAGQGAVVALVSHDVDAVDGLCQRLLVLRGGRITATHDDAEGIGREAILERYGAARA